MSAQDTTDQAAEKLFTQMLREGGLPVTAEEMQAEWESIVVEQGSLVTNYSAFSPFWRLVTAIVTRPCQWLVRLLVTYALPNLFLRFAHGPWLDLYAWGVCLERKPAQKAVGEVTFYRAPGFGIIRIPAGTVVETPPLNGWVYQVITQQEAVLEDGAEALAVPVLAATEGAACNLGPGYYSILPKPIHGIARVANEAGWLAQPGADEEADEPLRLRCRNQFAAVGQYHHDAAYKALISAYTGIRLDYIFFGEPAPRGPGTRNGYIMTASGPAPQELVDDINRHIRDSGNHGHGDDLLCYPMPVLPITLTATVYPKVGLDAERAEVLRQAVENRLRCAFRENQAFEITRALPLNRFSFSRLADELHGQLGDLRSITFSQSDIVAQLELPMLAGLEVNLGAGL